jgi:hypothetical protein
MIERWPVLRQDLDRRLGAERGRTNPQPAIPVFHEGRVALVVERPNYGYIRHPLFLPSTWPGLGWLSPLDTYIVYALRRCSRELCIDMAMQAYDHTIRDTSVYEWDLFVRGRIRKNINVAIDVDVDVPGVNMETIGDHVDVFNFMQADVTGGQWYRFDILNSTPEAFREMLKTRLEQYYVSPLW